MGSRPSVAGRPASRLAGPAARARGWAHSSLIASEQRRCWERSTGTSQPAECRRPSKAQARVPTTRLWLVSPEPGEPQLLRAPTSKCEALREEFPVAECARPVSYTHLTLPTN